MFTSRKISKSILWICVLIILYIYFLQAYVASLATPTFHIDGAFQTFSALWRLLHDEMVGKDFYFYLGIGPLYLLYPFYAVLGGSLADSMFISFFSVKIIFLISLFILTKISLRFDFLKTLLFTLLFYGIFLYFTPSSYIHFFMDPGNSLKSIRRFAPILGAIFLLFIVYLPKNSRVYYLGLMGGLLATWSNDFGYFSAFFLSFYFIYEYFTDNKSIKYVSMELIKFGLVSLATYILIISIVTRGHALDWVVYNFQGVGKNQWWYYPSYTNKIFSLDEIYKLIYRKELLLNISIIISPLLIVTLFILATRQKNISNLILSYIGMVLVSGAFISEYLGHIGGSYWWGIYVWLPFAILSILSTILLYFLRIKLNIKIKNILIFSISMLLLIFYVDFMIGEKRLLEMQEKTIKKNPYNSLFESYLDPSFLDYIQFFESIKQENNASLVEEYTSLASIVLSRNPPVPFDSVIHALGKENQILYISSLEKSKPKYITTTNPKFNEWSTWSFNQNWWFYSYLFKHYSIKKIFHNQYVWERYKKSMPFMYNEKLHCEVKNNNIYIRSDASVPIARLLNARINYTLTETKKLIILLDNDLHCSKVNNLSMFKNTSIDTTKKVNSISLPVSFQANETKHILTNEVYPRKKTDFFSIKSCQVQEISSKSKEYYTYLYDDALFPFHNVMNKKMKMKKNENVKFLAKSLYRIKEIGENRYQVLGNDPFLVYDIAKYNVSGKDVGLLSFDFECDNKNIKPKMAVFWSTDNYRINGNTFIEFYVKNGHVVVPLDRLPKWMNAKYIQQIRIDLQKYTDCKVFSIDNLKLNHRILEKK